MALQVFVANTELRWVDGSTTFNHVGAVTSDYPGQPSGRIWVNNDFLYYSDYIGQTRFIRGIYRGTTSAPAGRVFVNRGNCTNGQDLWWVGTNGTRFSVRGDNAQIPVSAGLSIGYVFAGYSNGWFNVSLSEPIKTAITVSGVVVSSYANGTCTTLENSVTLTGLVIPAGQIYATQSANLGTGQSYKISNTGSLTVNAVSRSGTETYCVGIDELTNIVSSLACVPTGGGTGTVQCGDPCVIGATDPANICDPNSGCSECSAVSNTCIDPAAGGGEVGTGCGGACTSNVQCTNPACPYCSPSNVCYEGELI